VAPAGAVNIVHDSAIKAGVRLCGPLAWRDRPDFTCFQAGSEIAAIGRGVAAELGPLANTPGQDRGGAFRGGSVAHEHTDDQPSRRNGRNERYSVCLIQKTKKTLVSPVSPV